MLTVLQRYGQTDGRTDGRLTIAIPRFALRASRGKNERNRLGVALNCNVNKHQTSLNYRIIHVGPIKLTELSLHLQQFYTMNNLSVHVCLKIPFSSVYQSINQSKHLYSAMSQTNQRACLYCSL